MSEPFVTIDLHGMMQAQAMKAIDRALAAASPTTYQIRLIHGYHRGTNLRSMIQQEYRWHEKVLRIQPGDNPGVTVLILRELY
ncbi:MAG: Smr/MutS family protein [Clostridia bacterium]|nr:Smr/MutS family protein [Clostridia bacterium]